MQVILPHANTGGIFEFEEIVRFTLCGNICLPLVLLASVNVFLFPHISVCPRSGPSPRDFSEPQLFLFSSKRLRTGVVLKEHTLWSLLKSWMYIWLCDYYFLKLGYSRRLWYVCFWSKCKELSYSVFTLRNMPSQFLVLCELWTEFFQRVEKRKRGVTAKGSQFGLIGALPILLSDCSLWPSLEPRRHM